MPPDLVRLLSELSPNFEIITSLSPYLRIISYMEVIDSLVEWENVYLRVRGAKVLQILFDLIQKKQLPISDLRLEFLEGELQVSARIQKGIAIPVKLTVRRIHVEGMTLYVPLESVATFGIVPIPKLLFKMIGTQRLPEGIQLDPETLTLAVSLERFLPPFIDLKIEAIRIVPGGMAVHLGPGSAGLPPHFALG
jgi:hypothetical protein